MAHIHAFYGPNVFVADVSVSNIVIFLVLQGCDVRIEAVLLTQHTGDCDVTGVLRLHIASMLRRKTRRPKLFNFQ
jgi:hypothetical protein